MQHKLNRKKNLHGFTLVEMMIVVVTVGLLLAIALPNFVRAREQARAKACSRNLHKIDGAKQLWAMDRKIPSTNTTSIATLDNNATTGLVGSSLYIRAIPSCPSNGAYTMNSINLEPSCNASTSAYRHTVNGQ